MVFRNILLSAIMVGLISGALYGTFQHLQISPIIYAAEEFEVAEESAPVVAVVEASVIEAHSHGSDSHGSHHHDEEAWGPEDGFERIAYTIGADVAVGIAFALFMISFMALHNLKASKPKVGALSGAAWGIAALMTFFVAPALFGLHPEVPGTEAAVLQNRQGWWLLCAVLTACGIAILYYAPMRFKLVGGVVALTPHLIGAPMPEQHGFANTDVAAVQALTELASQFYLMTSVGMILFFVVLGVMSGGVVNRFVRLSA